MQLCYINLLIEIDSTYYAIPAHLFGAASRLFACCMVVHW